MSSLVGKLFGSKATPVQTSYTPTQFESLPQFARDAFQSAVGQAQGVAGNTAMFAPTDFNPDQLAGFELARQGYNPVTEPEFSNQVAMFSNPYESQVIGGLESDMLRAARGLTSDLGSDATQAGAFGGTRQAVAQGAIGEAALRSFGQQAANLRSQGFQSAADRAISNIGLTNTLQQQQMSDLSTIGGLQQAQATQTQQAPLDAIDFLLKAAMGVPTGGGNTGSQLRENTGFLGRLGQMAANFGTAAKGFGA